MSIDLEKPMLRVTFGGYGAEFILPWEDGVQLLRLMRDAVSVMNKYSDGKTVWSRSDTTAITVTAFPPEAQAHVLMSGNDHKEN